MTGTTESPHRNQVYLIDLQAQAGETMGGNHVSLRVSNDSGRPRIEDINLRIEKLGRFSRFSRAGLGVIVLAFLIAVIGRLPQNLESVDSAINAILLPLIFVGMGLLLYAIGMHLHLMHLNLVKQIRKSEVGEGDTPNE